jgi:DNA polymerase I-like protein with 3'-5' exonuclease and polymerase domains/uracil-DNA glycosylase
VGDGLDPVEVFVVGDPPFGRDAEEDEYMRDPLGRRVTTALKALGVPVFVLPAVRCYPRGDIDHFILKKKYKGGFVFQRKTALDYAYEGVTSCQEYLAALLPRLRPRLVVAMGPLATEALGLGRNVHALRVQPLQRLGIKTISQEGTFVTFDRAMAAVSEWAARDLFDDLERRLPSLLATGHATPRGKRETIKHTVLTTVGQVAGFVDQALGTSDLLAFDYETAGLPFSPKVNRLLNAGFAFRGAENDAVVIPLAHPETPFLAEDLPAVYDQLRKLLDPPKGVKLHGYIAHNAQFEAGMTKAFLGVWLGETADLTIYDTMILAYLENENRHGIGIERPYALETLASSYLDFRWYQTTQIKGRRDKLIEERLDAVNEYVGIDAAVTARLFNHLARRLKAEGSFDDQMRIAERLYSPAIRYTTDLTLTGQLVDVDLLRMLRMPNSSIHKRLHEIEETFDKAPEVAQAMGTKKTVEDEPKAKPLFQVSSKSSGFSISSPLHRKALFWDVMKLEGADASQDKFFQKMHEAEPLVALYSEYNKLAKLDNAYLAPIADFLQESPFPDVRVRPSFNLINTTSGRLSASNPNCFDAETEILTRRGWVPFPALRDEDAVAQWSPNGDVGFVMPTEVIRQPYQGDMVSLQGGVDLLVTPDHRCPLRHPRTDAVEVVAAREYPSDDLRQPHAGTWRGKGVTLPLTTIRLICAAQEGEWDEGGMTWRYARRRQFTRLKLQELSASFSYNQTPDGQHVLHLPHGPLLQEVKNAIGQDKLFTPKWILSLDRATLDAFVDEVKHWGKNGIWAAVDVNATVFEYPLNRMPTRRAYASVHKQNVDVVQMAFALSGRRSLAEPVAVAKIDSKGTTTAFDHAWAVFEAPNSHTLTKRTKKTVVPYTGMVYCVTVPTSFVVVRRYGTVCVSGNSQQMPRGDTRDKKQIKALFKAPAGRVLVQLDFSQAEVRWLGILSGDEALARKYGLAEELKTALLRDPTNKDLQRQLVVDGDLHMSTALDMYRLPRDLPFTDEDKAKKARQDVKTICFGLIYGKIAFSLAKDLKIPEEEAEEKVNLWMSQFPQAAQWLFNVDEDIGRTGIALSPFGRRRRLPEAKASNVSVRNRAKRQARNTPIQSAASDFCIYAACKLRDALRAHPMLGDVRLINTVHDSLVAEVPAVPEVVEAYCRLAKAIFTDRSLIESDFGVLISIPLAVDFEVGPNWGNLQGYNLTPASLEQCLHNARVLAGMPTGTLYSDLKGKGLLLGEKNG